MSFLARNPRSAFGSAGSDIESLPDSRPNAASKANGREVRMHDPDNHQMNSLRTPA